MHETIFKQKISPLTLIVVLIFTLILAACGDTPQQPADQAPAATETPVAPDDADDADDVDTDTDTMTGTDTMTSTDTMTGTDTMAGTDTADEPIGEAVINTESGMTLTPPAGWKAHIVGTDILVESTQETRLFLTISNISETDLEAMGIEDPADATNSLLLDSFAAQPGIPAISDDRQETTIDGQPALIADMDMDEGDESLIGKIAVSILEGEDRAFLLMASFAEADWDEDRFMGMLGTISFMEPKAQLAEGLLPGEESSTEETAPSSNTEEADPTSSTDEDSPIDLSPITSENVAIVLGYTENRISVLADDAWIEPDVSDVNMATCLIGTAFFDADGKPWISCADILVTSRDGGATWVEIPNVAPFPFMSTAAINPSDNTIWLLQDDLITVMDAATEAIVATYAVEESTGEESFPTDLIAFAPDGTVWIGGMNMSGSEIVSFDGTDWIAYGETEDGDAFASPESLFINEDGDLWIFTSFAVYTLEDGTLTEIISESPMTVNDVVILDNGEVWAATYAGIKIWDGSSWSDLTLEDGLPSDQVKDMNVDASGHVWIATEYGLAVQDGNGGWNIAVPSTSGIAESHLASVAIKGNPTLPPPAATPTVASMRGRILYGDTPVADTSVQICGEMGNFIFEETPCETLLLSEMTQTDDEGVFVFDTIPLASYHIYARDPNATQDGGEWIDLTFASINVLEAGVEVDAGDFDLAQEDMMDDDSFDDVGDPFSDDATTSVLMDTDTWESFMSMDGGFIISFPSEEYIEEDMEDGKRYSLIVDDVVFQVRYQDLEESTFELDDAAKEELLLDHQTEVLDTMKATLDSSEDIQIGDHPGRNISATMPVQDAFDADVRIRIYLVDNRMYTISVAAKTGGDTSDLFGAFLNSFVLIR